jgi:hypothetical protein
MSEITLSEPSEQILDDVRRDKNIKPHEVQEEFLQIPDAVFEALYGGAAYGGKSWLLTLLPIFRGFYKVRGFKGIIFRRKFPDLEREIIRLSKEYYPKTGGKYNEQKHSWEWPDYGSYLDFGHVQHDSDISMYDSAQYNYGAFDELTHFSAYPYHYMVGSRIRPGNDFPLAIVRNGTNPGGIGQTFVYNRFVKPAEEGRVVIRDTGTGLYRIFIPATLEDNPYGLKYDPLYAKKLEILKSVNEAEYKAKRYGDWHAFKGSVFTTYRPIHFSGEPDNALHVIDPFQIPEWWPRFLCVDWGKRAMCYAMWFAISPDRRMYIYREKSWQGKDIAIWGSEIRELHDGLNETVLHTTLCGSAWQSRGSETISDDFLKYVGLVPQSSENTSGSRVATLQTVHDFMRWEQKTALKAKGEFYDMAKSQEIYRKYGPDAQARYTAQFMDEGEEINLPRLQIFKTCTLLIETIPVCIYDDKKIEDIAEFDGDDPIDDLRYACKTARKYLDGEIGNLALEEKKAEIVADLAVDNDMTRLYRRMEALEKGNNIIHGINRSLRKNNQHRRSSRH